MGLNCLFRIVLGAPEEGGPIPDRSRNKRTTNTRPRSPLTLLAARTRKTRRRVYLRLALIPFLIIAHLSSGCIEREKAVGNGTSLIEQKREEARQEIPRIYILNHAPDELLIVNSKLAVVERRLPIADGLRQLVFSSDGRFAYITSLVDVVNKVSVLDTKNYSLRSFAVEIIPEGVDMFPDNKRLVLIAGAKTNFESRGFDVVDLTKPDPRHPERQKVLYRERSLRLVSRVKVSEDGKYIYTTDARSSIISCFDVEKESLSWTADIKSAPSGWHFPNGKDFFLVSSLRDRRIYVLSRNGGKILKFIPTRGIPRDLVTDREAELIYAPIAEDKNVAVIDVEAGKVVDQIPLGDESEIIAMSPHYDELYLVGRRSGILHILNLQTRAQKLVQMGSTGEFRDITVKPLASK